VHQPQTTQIPAVQTRATLIPPPPWRRTEPRHWAAEVPVDDGLRELARFPQTDYADTFEASTVEASTVEADAGEADAGEADAGEADVGGGAEQYTPEEWARAMFEDTRRLMRMFLRLGWRLLGIQLAPVGTPGHVLGWRIVKNAPDFVVLQTRSGLGLTTRLVLHSGGHPTLRFGTFVRCDGLIGRAAWFGVAPLHRLIVSHLLGEATTH